MNYFKTKKVLFSFLIVSALIVSFAFIGPINTAMAVGLEHFNFHRRPDFIAELAPNDVDFSFPPH